MSYKIQKNRWDNWYGYEGNRRVAEFGTREDEAKRWLAERESEDTAISIPRLDGGVFKAKPGSVAHKLHKAGWKLARRKKSGMTILATWYHPTRGTFAQWQAWAIESQLQPKRRRKSTSSI